MKYPESTSEVLRAHLPCPECGSSDALCEYTDGHTYCFSCGAYSRGEQRGEDKGEPKEKTKGLIPYGEAKAIHKRGLSSDTCRLWGYTVSVLGGATVQVANYRDDSGSVIAQKVRDSSKEFRFLGDTKAAGLYGQHLWRNGGKRLVITEGELDALSVSQSQGNKWPVVSLPNGAQGARKSLAKQVEWLNKFDKIILCFDMDEPGQKAVADCVTLFPPGKVAVANLPMKDANEMLVAGRQAELVQRLWEAKDYRPDGIVTIADVMDEVLKAPQPGQEWFLESLTGMTDGRRLGEICGLGAGTGVGKSDFIAEQISCDLQNGLKVGAFLLEQQPAESIKRISGKLASKRFHVRDSGWTQDDLKDAIEALQKHGKLYLYDNFGAAEWAIIRERIRFLAHSEGVQYFYLDHLTALAAAEENEREALETIMAEMGSLVKELNIWIFFVSHLATPDGKPHEEGGRVTIRHFKGSRAIGFWSHFMFGLERDQQCDDEEKQHQSTFRVLKDRYTGQATGKTITLNYNQTTGRLSEGAPEFGELTEF